MEIHFLSGFLGSGKTTMIYEACKLLLGKSVKVAVITNDQGSQLVDGLLFRRLGIPERQVGNGCFCCNYTELENNIDALERSARPDVIFAESVGTCTDVIATVLKPFGKSREEVQLSLTAVVDARLLDMMIHTDDMFETDVRYIYFKQLEEAQMIVVNKTDLVSAAQLTDLSGYLNRHYPGKNIFSRSKDETPHVDWLNYVSNRKPQLSDSLQINYDQYANGEALMGYLDQEVVIHSSAGQAQQSAIELITAFTQQIKKSGATIGHVKFWLNNSHKISFTATTSDDIRGLNIQPANECAVVVNARVETDPLVLAYFFDASVSSIRKRDDIFVEMISRDAFKPGYPKPLHRIS